MSFRTVVIKQRSKLEYKLGYLVVRSEDEKKIHLSEISTLIIESTAVALTTSLIVELVKNNITLVFCDEKHLPHSFIEACHGHHTSSKNIGNQILWDENEKSLLWKEITILKIKMQARVLEKHGAIEKAQMLLDYADEVMPNDQTNREGHAAKVYFNALFGNEFSRKQENETNILLNYGYSIILSTFCREIVAAGYITQLGIWHHSDYNHYNLGSDFMEAFRPIIDDYAIDLVKKEKEKQHMARILLSKMKIGGQVVFMEHAIRIFVRELLKCLNKEKNISSLSLFEYTFPEDEL